MRGLVVFVVAVALFGAIKGAEGDIHRVRVCSVTIRIESGTVTWYPNDAELWFSSEVEGLTLGEIEFVDALVSAALEFEPAFVIEDVNGCVEAVEPDQPKRRKPKTTRVGAKRFRKKATSQPASQPTGKGQ